MQPFDKTKIIIVIHDEPNLLLRAATEKDIEKLRQWKNSNRQFFFHHQEIHEEQQRIWFSEYLNRTYDFMLMTEFRGQAFGCMGIRWLDTHWDIYNVILGRSEFGRKGYMSITFKNMMDYALSIKNTLIKLQVLKQNPAIKWYFKNGFIITDDHNNYYTMKYKPIMDNQEER